MEITVIDKRSRITLGKKLEKRFGKRFIVIPTYEEIILRPVSTKDPLEDLKEIGKMMKINRFSNRQLKKMAEEEAIKEAIADLK